MTKTRYITIGVIVVLILIGFSIYYLYFVPKPTPQPVSQPEVPQLGQTESVSLEEELKKYEVPEKGEVVEEKVAPPVEVAPSAPSSESSFRLFEMKGENKEFSPKEVRVYQNDIVSIRLLAVDGDYDFAVPDYGISTRIAKGTDRRVEFQATNIGKFPIICVQCKTREQGYLIVVPKTR